MALLQGIRVFLLIQVPLFFEGGLGFSKFCFELLDSRVVFFRSILDLSIPGAEQDLGFLISKLGGGFQFPLFHLFQMLLARGREVLELLGLFVLGTPSRGNHDHAQTKSRGN